MRKKRALIVSSVIGFLVNFEQNDIAILQNMGYEVHCATNFKSPYDSNKKELFDCLNTCNHQIDFERKPTSTKNIKAYRQLKKVIKEIDFDLVHCHTPIGGVVGRIAAHNCGVPKIIYSAHGFHFYKGAPLKNWLIYYSVEKFLSKYTDLIITINNYDFVIASEKFYAKKTYMIHGVGVNLDKFDIGKFERNEIRTKLGLKADDVFILSVGELTPDKNQRCIIEIMNILVKEQKTKFIAMIAGEGPLNQQLESEIKNNGLENNMRLLGYRTDVPELLAACDVFVFTSKFEGLPVALMEAVAMKKPIICSRVRGNTDIIIDNEQLFDYGDSKEAAYKIMKMLETDTDKIVERNFENLKHYSLENVSKEMHKIYSEI